MIPATDARDVMNHSNSRFFGLPENACFLKAKLTEGQRSLETLSRVPFSGATLLAVRDDSLLMAALHFSIDNFKQKFPELFCGQIWFENEPFALETGQPQWVLISKTSLAGGAVGETFPDQLKMLSAGCEVPSAREVVYAILAHHFVSGGEWLFKDCSVRTSSLSLDGYPVDVGVSTISNPHYQPGIIINHSHPLSKSHKGETKDLGLAFKRKPEVVV